MATRSKAIRLSLICSAAVFVIVALITLVAVLVFDRLFLSILYKQLAILPGSTVFKSWSAPSVPVYFSVYLFNLTNEAELLKGAAPRLHEVGPFVYRENREKFDIVFPEESSPKTVDFKHRIFYHFVPEMSVASPELGKITIPNLFTAGLLERQSPVFFMNGPFATLSPYDAMWNHYPLLFSSINVGLFASQNGTKPVQYKIHTGSHDISKVGSIIEVNGQKKLSVWDHEEANMINGSDGSNAPPGLEVGSTIQFYVNDICRSVVSYAVAKTQAINRPDIELLVFTGTPPDPQDPANDWRQRMFCKSGQGCPPKGLLALSPCLAATGESVPLYLSQPYFLGADPSIVQAFDQFPDPIPERHSTWVHIEPTTGFVLEAFKRIQFNLLMKNQGEIFQDMAGPYYFPLGWIEERAVADKDTLDMLHNKLFAPRKIMPFILSVVGAVSTLISILLIVLLVTYSRRRTIQNRTKRSGAHKQHAVSVNLSHSKMGPSDQVQIVQPNQYADRQQTPGLSSGPGANTQVPEAKPLLNVTETADVNRIILSSMLNRCHLSDSYFSLSWKPNGEAFVAKT
ncbi:Scavenger receptor class B member 1 [Fasciola hepatica]|uniref:Scavenger receptor class B member 1 n=1 Tax=Fasciola hepatica TaxID=6192 RepID=A0A4E0S2R7_FASHE|nr:Scavenger receptor class B member 1 [Fasciola hepatica]